MSKIKIQNKLDEIIKKYSGKVLAYSNYGNPSPDFFTDDFVDLPKLRFILSEVNSSESTITSDGLDFLEEYYDGIEELAGLLEKMGGVDGEYLTAERIIWFFKIIKNEIKK